MTTISTCLGLCEEMQYQNHPFGSADEEILPGVISGVVDHRKSVQSDCGG
jgi:hypothetical protein